MFLNNKLEVSKITLSLPIDYEFNVHKKICEEYLTEFFELFSEQSKNLYLFSHYKRTQKASSSYDHEIHKQNGEKAYIVQKLDIGKDLWTYINNRRLKLNNILTN